MRFAKYVEHCLLGSDGFRVSRVPAPFIAVQIVVRPAYPTLREVGVNATCASQLSKISRQFSQLMQI